MDSKKIALFTLFVVLFSFFYVVVNAEITGQATRNAPHVNVEGVSCTWKQDHFEICETIGWEAGQTYYAKGYIAGGEPLTKSPKLTSSPTIYCQNIGSTGGKRAVHAYLYSTQGTIKALSIDNIVSCSQSQPRTATSKISFGVQASKEFRKRESGSGTFRLEGFSGKPVMCTFSGRWVVNGRQLEQSTELCNQATGSFEGVMMDSVQKTVVDAHPFSWQDIEGLFQDPDPEEFPGYIAYAKLCDRTDYKSGRYYAGLRVLEKEESALVLGWDIKSHADIAVDFIAEAKCNVATEEEPAALVASEPEEAEETPEVASEPAEEAEEAEEPVGEPIKETWSLWQSFASWFRSIFK